MVEHGELEKVAVRTLWPGEARDFTPWLAASAGALSEALGIDLDLVGSEVAVGPFSADLVFDDTSGHGTVVVENMFGQTDHDHVGKLVTYAAGLEATCAVLIAEHFRPDHLSALNWLNTSSRDEVAFFGIEVEVWRIGDSLPAPKLNVVARPDTWAREVRPSGAGDLSARRLLYRDWWAEFLPELRDRYPGWTNARIPQPQNWMNFPAGRTGLSYGAVLTWLPGTVEQRLRVELYIDPGDAAETDRIFQFLRDRREGIELAAGASLDWQELEERRASRIAMNNPTTFDVADRATWPAQREWAIAAAGKLRAALQPQIQAIPPLSPGNL